MRCSIPKIANEQVVLATLVVFALFGRVVIALVVPAWQGPDEPKHYEYVPTLLIKRDQLWAERRLLGLDDRILELQHQIIDSMARHHFWEFLGLREPDPLPAYFMQVFGTSWTQLHRPSTYYFLGALVALPLQGRAVEDQLTAMRLLSAVLSGLAVVPAYLVGRLVAPRDTFVPIACGALVAMLPMGVFMGGVMNPDNLLVLVGGLAVLGMTRGVVRGFTLRTWIFILGSVLLGLLTKRGAVILLPGVLVCAGIWLVRLHEPARRWMLAGLAATAILVAVGATAGWSGVILPLQRAQSTVVAYALNSPSQWDNLLNVPLTAGMTRQILAAELIAYFDSFWGMFGWFTTPLRPEVYSALIVLTIVCALGCLVWLVTGQRGCFGQRLTLATLFGTLLASAVVAGLAERLAYYSVNEVPQGRYLFVVLGAIAALYALGVRAWLPRSRTGTALPATAFVGGLLVLDIYAFLGVIVPYFSRTFQ